MKQASNTKKDMTLINGASKDSIFHWN